MDPTHRILGTVDSPMTSGQSSSTSIYAHHASSSSNALDQSFLKAPRPVSGTSSQHRSLSPPEATSNLNSRSGFFLEPNVQESQTFRIGEKQLGSVRLNEATIFQLFAQ